MAQKFISIKNFDKYQHYSQRNPPWIKLYKSLLTDLAFMKLDIHSRYLYVGLLIIASETDNRVPNDPSYLAHRLVIDASHIDLKPLYRGGFLLASAASIRRYHHIDPLIDTDKRQITETEDKALLAPAPKPPRSRRDKLEGFALSQSDRNWAMSELSIPNADDYLEEFKDYWRGIDDKKLKSDWQATFRNRLRFLKEKGQLKESVWT